jgi:hypothetical protein
MNAAPTPLRAQFGSNGGIIAGDRSPAERQKSIGVALASIHHNSGVPF